MKKHVPQSYEIRIPVGKAHAGGMIDAIEAGAGTLAVVGWAADERAFASGLRLSGGGIDVTPTHAFRVLRPDLASLGGAHPERLGIIAEFILPAEVSGRILALRDGNSHLVDVRVPQFEAPPYSQLLGNPGVWHREDVYSVGPPQPRVSQDVLDLVADIEGPVLDFGCGAGALVAHLRGTGIAACGLELDLPAMRAATIEGLAGHVAFYDGTLPAPFPDGRFTTVTCCEVLEHIPDYEAAVAEVARLTSHCAILTVPDMSSIPRGAPHSVVPWHLLESSHVNFFTQASLAATLAPHFASVTFARIGEVRCDRLHFYTSLVAFCTKTAA